MFGFKIEGKTLALKGLRKPSGNEEEKKPFSTTYNRIMETPDIVLKKYMEMKDK